LSQAKADWESCLCQLENFSKGNNTDWNAISKYVAELKKWTSNIPSVDQLMKEDLCSFPHSSFISTTQLEEKLHDVFASVERVVLQVDGIEEQDIQHLDKTINSVICQHSSALKDEYIPSRDCGQSNTTMLLHSHLQGLQETFLATKSLFKHCAPLHEPDCIGILPSAAQLLEEANHLEISLNSCCADLDTSKAIVHRLANSPPPSQQQLSELLKLESTPCVQRELQEAIEAMYLGTRKVMEMQEQRLTSRAWAAFQPVNQLGLVIQDCLDMSMS